MHNIHCNGIGQIFSKNLSQNQRFCGETELFRLTYSIINKINLKGEIVDGDKKPSSEREMHRIFYEKRDDIDAIIHTHTMYATTLSCLRWKLPAVHYILASAGKDIRCAEYATFGTDELADNAFKAMKDRKAVLLANHGLLAGSNNLEDALSITEDIEYCSELYYRAKSIGEPVILDDEEMDIMVDRFKSYGQ